MARPQGPQPLSLIEAVVPVASLILLVGLSYYLFGDAGAAGPNQVTLVAATLGVPMLSYMPYAVFNIVSPLLAVGMAPGATVVLVDLWSIIAS